MYFLLLSLPSTLLHYPPLDLAFKSPSFSTPPPRCPAISVPLDGPWPQYRRHPPCLVMFLNFLKKIKRKIGQDKHETENKDTRFCGSSCTRKYLCLSPLTHFLLYSCGNCRQKFPMAVPLRPADVVLWLFFCVLESRGGRGVEKSKNNTAGRARTHLCYHCGHTLGP